MGMRTWQSWLWWTAKRAVIVYACLVVLAFLLQRRLIYMPGAGREEDLLRQAEENGLRAWRDRWNQLIGWRTSLPDGVPKPLNRLVVFHGNAGYALHRTYYSDGFRGVPDGAAKWDVFLFEYPGYGSRPGSRSESSIAAAADEALKDLLREDSRPVYLVGESLGSSFASRLAAEHPQSISGLLLVTPLTCLADVAAAHYPIFPVRWILLERHNTREYLKSYTGPAAFLVAGRDEIMKNGIGEGLYRQYGGLKKIWVQPNAGHNTLDLTPGLPLWGEIGDFLENSHTKTQER